jgi:hypothetical protein
MEVDAGNGLLNGARTETWTGVRLAEKFALVP